MFRRGLFYCYLSIYLLEYLGLTATETTLFATIPMATSAFFQSLVWGKLSDKLKFRKTLIITGEILAAIGTVALWYAHILPDNQRLSGYIIIFGLAVIEIFWSMSNVGWSALISDIYGESQRATIQGRLSSLGGAGMIVGVWVGGLLYDGLKAQYEGWGFQEGSLFFVAAGAMLISTIPMFFVPEGKLRNELKKQELSAGVSHYPVRVFIIFLLAMVFIHFGRNAMAVLRSPFLRMETGFGLSSQEMSYLINIRSVAMIATGLGAGIFCKRFGNSRSLVLGCIASIVALLIFGFAPSVYIAGIGNVLTGSADVIIMTSSYAFAAILIPAHKRGHYFGLFNSTMFLSWGLAGTVVAGPLIDLLVTQGAEELFAYRMAFVASASITSIGLGILVSLLIKMAKYRS